MSRPHAGSPVSDVPTLLRRFRRLFDRVPYLAAVTVSATTRDRLPALAFCLEFGVHRMDLDVQLRHTLRAERAVRRVARVLWMRAVIEDDDTVGPSPWGVLVYRREGPSWALWAPNWPATWATWAAACSGA